MPVELRRLAPDLVHLHFPNPTGDLAYLLSGCRAPVVMTYHADIAKPWPALRLYRTVFERLESRIARIIVSSEVYLRSSRFLARHQDKCIVIPYGIDPEPFALRDREAEAVRRLRQEHGSPMVAFLGVLRPYKGLPVLLRAMAKVRGHLLIVGRGHAGELEGDANQLGVADRVSFVAEVSETQRRLLLHACDVFVLPSLNRSEAFGIVQLEAMACGKPVVSTDLPTGVSVVNQHGTTGLLVRPDDPEALADALNRLLVDQTLRRSLGQAGYSRVEREYRAEPMVERTLAVYDEVLSGQSREVSATKLTR